MGGRRTRDDESVGVLGHDDQVADKVPRQQDLELARDVLVPDLLVPLAQELVRVPLGGLQIGRHLESEDLVELAQLVKRRRRSPDNVVLGQARLGRKDREEGLVVGQSDEGRSRCRWENVGSRARVARRRDRRVRQSAKGIRGAFVHDFEVPRDDGVRDPKHGQVRARSAADEVHADDGTSVRPLGDVHLPLGVFIVLLLRVNRTTAPASDVPIATTKSRRVLAMPEGPAAESEFEALLADEQGELLE